MRVTESGWYRRLRGTQRARDLTDAAATALVGLLTLAVGIRGVWSDVPERGPSGLAASSALLALGCGLMVVKRRWPVAVLAAGVALFAVDAWLGGSVGVVVVLVDLLYSAALLASARAAAAVATVVGAVGAAGALVVWSVTLDLRITVFLVLQYVALVGTPLWWGTAVRRQSELTDLATARAEDQRRLASLRVAELVADERTRMARDLHDAIAGHLSAITIHAGAALAVPPDDPRAGARDRAALEAVRAASVTSLQEMRSMILLLRAGDASAADPTTAAPRLHDADGLVSAGEAAGLRLTWEGAAPADLPALPSAVDQAAYRILQESLTNAAKHVPGAHVRVALGVRDGELALTVESTAPAAVPARAATGTSADGPGRAALRSGPDGGTRLGLLTMRERAEALGGRFTAGWTDAAPDGRALPGDAGGPRRWAVAATLPLGTS